MKRRGVTSPLQAQQICQFIAQPAIWQARLLLLKDVIQAHHRHRAVLPSFPPSLFYPAFSIPGSPRSSLQSVELLPHEIEKASPEKLEENKGRKRERGKKNT